MESIVEAGPAIGELAGRLQSRLIRMGGIARSGEANHHDFRVIRTIKKFLPVPGPRGHHTSARGNLLSAVSGNGSERQSVPTSTDLSRPSHRLYYQIS